VVDKNDNTEVWQGYELTISHGTTTLHLPAADSSHQDRQRQQEHCVLCRSPRDELEGLIGGIRRLLDGASDVFEFEPAEPSFELRFEHQAEGEFRTYLWLNTGNVETEIYRWNSIGIRLFATESDLRRFTDELESEFS